MLNLNSIWNHLPSFPCWKDTAPEKARNEDSSSESAGDEKIKLGQLRNNAPHTTQAGSTLENKAKSLLNSNQGLRSSSNWNGLPDVSSHREKDLRENLKRQLANGQYTPAVAGSQVAYSLIRRHAELRLAMRNLCVLAMEARRNDERPLCVAAAAAMFELAKLDPEFGDMVQKWASPTSEDDGAEVEVLGQSIASDPKPYIDNISEIVASQRDQAGEIVGKWCDAMILAAHARDMVAFDGYASLIVAALISEDGSDTSKSDELEELVEIYQAAVGANSGDNAQRGNKIGSEFFDLDESSSSDEGPAIKPAVLMPMPPNGDASEESCAHSCVPGVLRVGLGNTLREGGVTGYLFGKVTAGLVVSPLTNLLFRLGGWGGALSVGLSSLTSFGIACGCEAWLRDRTDKEMAQNMPAAHPRRSWLLQGMRYAALAAPLIAPGIFVVAVPVAHFFGSVDSVEAAAKMARIASETLLTGQLSRLMRQFPQSFTQHDLFSGWDLEGEDGRKLKEHQKIQINMWRDFVYTAISCVAYIGGMGVAYAFSAWLDAQTGGVLSFLGINPAAMVGGFVAETADGAIPDLSKYICWSLWGGKHEDGHGFELKNAHLPDTLSKKADHFIDNAAMRVTTGVAGCDMPAMLVNALQKADAGPLALCLVNGLAGCLNGLLTGPRARWLKHLTKPDQDNPSGLAAEVGHNIGKNFTYLGKWIKERWTGTEILTDEDTLNWQYTSEVKPDSIWAYTKKKLDQQIDSKLVLRNLAVAALSKDGALPLLQQRADERDAELFAAGSAVAGGNSLEATIFGDQNAADGTVTQKSSSDTANQDAEGNTGTQDAQGDTVIEMKVIEPRPSNSSSSD